MHIDDNQDGGSKASTHGSQTVPGSRGNCGALDGALDGAPALTSPLGDERRPTKDRQPAPEGCASPKAFIARQVRS